MSYHQDERSFFACSPHRIEMAAQLIREGYFADYANPALRLLPEWTQWCIEQSGLNADARWRATPLVRALCGVFIFGFFIVVQTHAYTSTYQT